MEIGIFSKTYEGSLETVFKKMVADGIHETQFNMLSAGMETIPKDLVIGEIMEIKALAKTYKIKLSALSGTFNMIDPDMTERLDGIERFRVLCEIASYLEIPVITLCTGSKNPQSKWSWDDHNLDKSSWDDLIETTHKLIEMAEYYNLILGVEPEVSNIVNTPLKAREFLDQIKSPHLKIVMDGANLFLPDQVKDMDLILKNAFELLGADICLAHAKDIGAFGEEFVAAGEGVLNFEYYIELLIEYNYQGALIMHGLSSEQVVDSKLFLERMKKNATI